MAHRLHAVLDNAGIEYIGDLVQKTRAEVLEIPNLGPKSLAQIEAILAELGMSLGMKLDEWERPVR